MSDYLRLLHKMPLFYKNIFPKFLSDRDKVVIQSMWFQPDNFVRGFVDEFRKSNDSLFDFAVKSYITRFLQEMGGETDEMDNIVDIIRNKLEDLMGVDFEVQRSTIEDVVRSYVEKEPDEPTNKWFRRITG